MTMTRIEPVPGSVVWWFSLDHFTAVSGTVKKVNHDYIHFRKACVNDVLPPPPVPLEECYGNREEAVNWGIRFLTECQNELGRHISVLTKQKEKRSCQEDSQFVLRPEDLARAHAEATAR